MMVYPERSAFTRAAEIIRSQGFTPKSPCSVDEQGSLHLCAAAALAAAGLELHKGVAARSQFEEKIGQLRQSKIVHDAFDELGWDRVVCDRVFQKNDLFSDASRTTAVLGMFSSDQHPQWP